jgi:SRSO17 transposase
MVCVHAAIVKFILSLQLGFSKPQIRHLCSIINGIILCEGRKNISTISEAAGKERHLSSTTRFLNESPWSVNRMQKRRMERIMQAIRNQSRNRGRRIIFLLVDDTSCKKESTTRRMEGLDFHYSHENGKSVWSHCIVTMHLVSEGQSYAWDYRPYFREKYCEEHRLAFKSKNELAVAMIEAFPSDEADRIYVLADSWYTSRDLLDACNARGFHVIAAVKSNRTICPAGIRTSMSDFAATYIDNADLRSVTVENKRYRVYAYEGPLADTENVRVLLSWEGKFDANECPFCIVCTDLSLDLVTILSYYRIRWHIETGYRYFKELLGFDQYQLLSFKGINRYWAIQFLTQNLLELQRMEWSRPSAKLTLGDVVRRFRHEHKGQMLFYVFEQAMQKKPLFDILRDLKMIS